MQADEFWHLEKISTLTGCRLFGYSVSFFKCKTNIKPLEAVFFKEEQLT